jgi:hypothetical protein
MSGLRLRACKKRADHGLGKQDGAFFHGDTSVNAPHASTWCGAANTSARDSAGDGSMARSWSSCSGDGRQAQADVIGCDWLRGWWWVQVVQITAALLAG